MDTDVSYWSGTTTYTVYAKQYNGGTAWGGTVYGDGESVSRITNGSQGSYASYLPNSQAGYKTLSDTSYYASATSFAVLGHKLTLGASTSYNKNAEVKYSFNSSYPKYYLYDKGTNWKKIYVSHSAR